MKTHILRGSKEEIARKLLRIQGAVSEVIVFAEEPTLVMLELPSHEAKDVFAEMHSFMVDVLDVDDSRETVYSRTHGQ